MSIAEFIKRRPIIAPSTATVRDVIKIMAENNVGLVAIVDEEGRPVGVVSERDVVRALARGVSLDQEALSIGTRENLLTAKKNDDAFQVLKAMRARGVRHVLVIEESGVLAGVVSIRDLVEDRALKQLGERVWWPPPEE